MDQNEKKARILGGVRMEIVLRANEIGEEGKQIQQLLSELLYEEDENGVLVHTHQGNDTLQLPVSVIAKMMRFTRNILRINDRQLQMIEDTKDMVQDLNAIIRQQKDEEREFKEKLNEEQEYLRRELHTERTMRIRNGIRLREAQDHAAYLEGTDPPTRETSVKREREE
jgi:hypothetical protein